MTTDSPPLLVVQQTLISIRCLRKHKNSNKFSHAINDYNGWKFKRRKKVISTSLTTAMHHYIAVGLHMVKVQASTHTHIIHGYDGGQ